MRSRGRVKFSADEFELRGRAFVLETARRGRSWPPENILSAGDRSNVVREDVDALSVQLLVMFSDGVRGGGVVELREIVKENS